MSSAQTNAPTDAGFTQNLTPIINRRLTDRQWCYVSNFTTTLCGFCATARLSCTHQRPFKCWNYTRYADFQRFYVYLHAVRLSLHFTKGCLTRLAQSQKSRTQPKSKSDTKVTVILYTIILHYSVTIAPLLPAAFLSYLTVLLQFLT